jgi:hypothetical protein
VSNCELLLMLDRTDATYSVGERITGAVEVNVTEKVRCRSLSVTQNWKTHGRGTVDEGYGTALTVFSGTWVPGRYRYTFAFDVVEPCTYRGYELNVDWNLVARVDIPWGTDPKVAAEYLVAPPVARAQPRRVDAGVLEKALSVASRDDDRDPWAGLREIIAIVCALCIAGLVALRNFLHDYHPSVSEFGIPSPPPEVGFESILLDFMLVVLGVLFLGIIFWVLRKPALALLWRVTVGSIRFAIGSADVVGGTEVPCAIRIRTRHENRISAVSVALRAEEVVTSGYGTNESTKRKLMHDQRVIIDAPLRTGRSLDFVAKVKIPDDAWPTFMSSNNSLRWFVEARVEGSMMPVWTARRDIHVGFIDAA